MGSRVEGVKEPGDSMTQANREANKTKLALLPRGKLNSDNGMTQHFICRHRYQHYCIIMDMSTILPPIIGSQSVIFTFYW